MSTVSTASKQWRQRSGPAGRARGAERGPEAARFVWRATCQWVGGTHSHSTVEKFFGLGEKHQHRNTFHFDVDHPEVFASEDKGATPV